MSGSCSTVSNKAEKSLVGMSVCTTVIGAETPASRSVSMATVIGCSSFRPPAAPRSAMTTGSAPWTGSGRPSRAIQSRQTEAARRVLGERVSAVDAEAHHLAGQVECLGHAPIVAETGRRRP